MTRLLLVLLLVTAVLAAACAAQPTGQPPGDGPGEPPSLAGRTFLSVGVTEGSVPRPLVAATQVRLDFREDGTLGASAGCNSMGATYQLDGGRLRIEGRGMTAMGCDPALHAQDAWLADFLAAGPAVTFADDQIALSSDAVMIQLVDEEVANPDRPLVGTRWIVAGIRTRDAVSSVPFGATATVQLAADGAVLIETGCNTGRTTATTGAGQLRLGELSLTRRACADPAVEDLERAVLAVIGAPNVTWSVQVDRLTLDAGGLGLDLRAG